MDTIEWLDKKQTILNVGNDSTVELVDEPRESGIAMYTCRATSIRYGSQNVTVNVQVLPKLKLSTFDSIAVPITVVILLLFTLILVTFIVIAFVR